MSGLHSATSCGTDDGSDCRPSSVLESTNNTPSSVPIGDGYSIRGGGSGCGGGGVPTATSTPWIGGGRAATTKYCTASAMGRHVLVLLRLFGEASAALQAQGRYPPLLTTVSKHVWQP